MAGQRGRTNPRSRYAFLADGADLPPTITIFDDASPSDLFSVFEQLGVSQLRQFGRMVVITATGIEEETLFLFAKWGVITPPTK